MSQRNVIRPRCLLALLATLAVWAQGCGGMGTSTVTVQYKDPEGHETPLPAGVTLDSPVIPDKAYGESSKTVGDALATLQANVKDRMLRDAKGNVIRFETPFLRNRKSPKASKTSKISRQIAPTFTVIRLAD